MGKFCLLTHAQGYLGAYSTTLDAGRKAQAEAEADNEVDDALDGFAVDLWTAATTPQSIRALADKLAAARFLRLAAAAINTVAAHDGDESLPATLEREARAGLAAIKNRGWYRDDAGTMVRREDPTQSPWEAEIVR